MDKLIIDQSTKLEPQIVDHLDAIIAGKIDVLVLERGSLEPVPPHASVLERLVRIARQHKMVKTG